jgi:hypothetical protein
LTWNTVVHRVCAAGHRAMVSRSWLRSAANLAAAGLLYHAATAYAGESLSGLVGWLVDDEGWKGGGCILFGLVVGVTVGAPVAPEKLAGCVRGPA